MSLSLTTFRRLRITSIDINRFRQKLAFTLNKTSTSNDIGWVDRGPPKTNKRVAAAAADQLWRTYITHFE